MKNLRQMIKNAVLFCMSVVLTFGITYGQYTADQIAGGASIARLPGIGNPAHVDDAFDIGIPGPLAVASNGDIAWADYWDGNLMYWNSTTDVIEMLIPRGSAMMGIGGPIADATNGDRIFGIIFDSENNIWYSNSNQVFKVDMTTRTLHHIAGSGLAGTPDFSLPMEDANLNASGIAFNHDESILYVNLIGPSMVAALHLATSEVEHIAGTGSQTDGIPAGLALLSNLRQPFGLDYVKDPATDIEWLYIASQQKMVYSVNLNTGILYPFAGTGAWNQSGDDGLATQATLLQPHDIVVDATNTYVYFGDHQGNHHGVRRVDVKTGIIERYTGIHNSPDLADWLEEAYVDPAKRVGHRLEIPTNRAVGVDLDNDGNLIVGTRSPLLFKVNVATDQMELIAGYKASPPPLDGPGTAGVQATAMSVEAWGVVTKDGKPYFFDVTSRKLVRLEDDGTTTVIAGNGETAFVGNATLATAQFNAIRYMILDKDGNIFASDFGHHTVYKIDLTAETVTVVAGTGAGGYAAEEEGGLATAARLNQPHGIRFNPDESILYIMDLNNRRLRAVDMTSGNISTFAFDGTNGETNAPTPRLTAKIQNGRDVVVDSDGNVYVATSQHKKIYKIDADNVTVLTPKVFRQPFGMFLDEANNKIWVSDEVNISTVDLSTGEVYNIGQVPTNWGISKDGNNVYVSGRAAGLFKINVDAPATLTQIQGYAEADDAADLTIAMLDELGAATIEFNLDAYKAAVVAKTAATLPTVESVQKLVLEVNAAQAAAVLVVIDGFAKAGDASALELFHLAIVGVANVVDANLPFYKAVIEAADGVADKAALQALINKGNVNYFLSMINQMATDDDASDLTFTLIRNAGATAANIRQNTFYNYLPHYKKGIEDATGVATVAELDAILIAANTAGEAALITDALAAVNDMAVANDAKDLTFALILNAGANKDLLNLDFLKYYIAGVEAATGVADAAALNAIIEAANTAGAAAEAASALAMINQMAVDNDASKLTRNMLVAAGVVNLMGDVPHFEAYQAGIEAAAGVADLAALQAIVNAANLQLAIDKIMAFADADDAAAMTLQQLVDAGVNPAVLAVVNLSFYRTAIAAATGADVDTSAKIEAIVVAANTSAKDAAITAIIAMAAAGNADDLTAIMLTQAELVFAEKYVEAYKGAVATAGTLADAAAIQTLLTFTATCEDVKAMAGTEAAQDLTKEMLTILGIVNVFDAIFAEDYYHDALFELEELLDCAASVQALVDGVNFAFIQEMAEFDYADDLTVELLEAVGVTNVIATLLDEYKTAIEAATEIADLAALQAIVDGANFAFIQDMAISNDAGDLTVELLEVVGVTNIIAAKLDEYKTAIAAAAEIADLAALQAIIDAVNVVSVNNLINAGLKVYPNPVRETLNIVSDITINEIRMVNTLGQVVHFDGNGTNSIRISADQFESGLYMLQVVTAEGTSVTKIMINR